VTETEQWGLTAVSASQEKYNTPTHKAVSFCCVKLAEITLDINLYELIVPFERCILETTNAYSKFLRILIQKM
jgi:hypothetical protein